MSFLVHRRLSVQRQTIARISIVQAGIREVRTLRIVPAIERLGVRLQSLVEMRVEGIRAQMQSMVLITQTAARLRHLQVVFLVHLRFRAVIVRSEDSCCRPVVVQRRIHRAIGAKGCQLEASAQIHRGCHTLQIRVAARTVCPDAVGGTSERLQQRHLPEREVAVHHQSHAHRHPIVPHA